MCTAGRYPFTASSSGVCISAIRCAISGSVRRNCQRPPTWGALFLNRITSTVTCAFEKGERTPPRKIPSPWYTRKYCSIQNRDGISMIRGLFLGWAALSLSQQQLGKKYTGITFFIASLPQYCGKQIALPQKIFTSNNWNPRGRWFFSSLPLNAYLHDVKNLPDWVYHLHAASATGVAYWWTLQPLNRGPWCFELLACRGHLTEHETVTPLRSALRPNIY